MQGSGAVAAYTAGPKLEEARLASMAIPDNPVKDRYVLCADTGAIFARLLNAGLAVGVLKGKSNAAAAGAFLQVER